MSVAMIMMISDDYYDVDEGVSSPICLVAPAASKCNINTLAKLLLTYLTQCRTYYILCSTYYVQCKCLDTRRQQGVHDEGTTISPLSKANSFSHKDCYCSVGGVVCIYTCRKVFLHALGLLICGVVWKAQKVRDKNLFSIYQLYPG